MAPEPNQFDRLPPHSIDAEMCLLGSLMLCDGDQALFAQCKAMVNRGDFYSGDHEILWDAIMRMHARKQGVNAITVREDLSRSNVLTEVGGAAFIGQILNTVPSWAHGKHYASIVREKALLRHAIRVGNELIRDAYAPRHGVAVEEAEALLANGAAKLSRAAAGGKSDQVHTFTEVAEELLAQRDSGEEVFLATGLARLDSIIGGLPRGGKTVIGARQGMGKSALIKHLAIEFAWRQIRVGIISVEESRTKIAGNMLAHISGVPNNRIRHGTVGKEEWIVIEASIGQAKEAAPIFIVDSARRLSSIQAMAHVLVAEHKCDVVAVDHLHIVDPETSERENREQQIAKISMGLKWTWKDMNVYGIEAAQLNKAGGQERPTPDNLRDSNALAQDADVALLMHREDYWRKKRGNGEAEDGICEIIVAKNKDGAEANIPVNFDELTQRFTDRSDVPEYL